MTLIMLGYPQPISGWIVSLPRDAWDAKNEKEINELYNENKRQGSST
jgi:hypothetical protein